MTFGETRGAGEARAALASVTIVLSPAA